MKPIIVTYSNESWIFTDDGFAALKKWDMAYFTILGTKLGTVIESKDIKLIARPKK